MVGQRSGIGLLSLLVWLVGVWMSPTYQAVGAAQAPAAAPGGDQAQIEKGRQAVGQACTGCHANILRVVQIHRKPAAEWRDTVYSMIGRGAQILPDEIEPLTAFLAATAGPDRPRAAAAAETARTAASPPQAEGHAILQRQCTQCHDLDTASRIPATDDAKTVIARMKTYGAEVSSADEAKLIEYLNGLPR